MSEQKSNHIRTVVKTDGTLVPFDPDRLNKWAQFANNYGLQWSEIVLNAYKKCTDGCSTKDLHKAMIDACVEMETHDHLRMAGRLALGSIYKEAHGGYKSIPTLKQFYERMVELGYWIAMDYSDEEFEKLEKIINHNKNLEYNFTTLNQMENRYLIRDLHSKICYESPQFMFMGISMSNMEKETDKEKRLNNIESLYNYLSDLKINMPTPMLVNLRTPSRGLASCNVYTVEDTAPSISVGDHIANMMTCASAGIGSHMLIRSKGDPIRGGRVIHQGKLPYYRVTEAVVHASKQACYDDQTEILTENGFVHLKDYVTMPMFENVKVAQVDKDRVLTYVLPTETHEYDNDGDMFEFDFDGSKFLVTENHEMIYRKVKLSEEDENKEDFYDYVRVEAQNLTINDLKNAKFDSTAKYKGSIIDTKYEHYIAFISQFFGNIKKVNEDEFEIEFTGSNRLLGEHIATNLFSKLNKRFMAEKENEYSTPAFEIVESHVINDDKVTVTINKKAMDLIDDAFVELKELERSQFLSVIDYINDRLETKEINDGTFEEKNEKSLKIRNIYSVNDNTISLFQALLTQNSVSSKRTEEGILEVYGDTYYVGADVDVKLVAGFTGKVYCVTVPTNNIVVRRDGSTLVCGNSRGGANTSFYPILDPEIEDLLVLKNPMTVQQKRVRNIDYAVQVNRLFVEKVARNEDWYTISYYYAPDLYDAFYSGDYNEFERLYKKYETHDKATKHKARTLATKMLTESVETGRIYLHYADEANRHTPFLDKIYSSNLCMEIALPTKPFPSMMDLYTEDSEGEIGLCSLASIVVGRVSDEEYEDIAYITTKMIDNTIDIMDYPFPSLKGTAQKRRSIGVGITNLAHLLASKGLSYASKEGKELMHDVAETHAYWMYKASLKLAKERGPAEWMSKSKYKDGWLPIDTYNKRVDGLGDFDLKHDWESLRKEMIDVGGIRNSTVLAFMPVESCLSKFTEIRTADGIKTLEEIFSLTGLDLEEEWKKLDKFTGGKWFDLKAPIEVQTLDGNKEVDKVWVNGSSSYMEIELEDGTVIKATHHHKFLVKDEDGNETWKMAMELEEGDDVVNVDEG